MVKTKDLNALGLESDYTIEQLKEAFRIKAKVVHPDHNKSPDASIQFRELLNSFNNLKSELDNPKKINIPKVSSYKSFHRPKVDTSSDSYQKMKKIASLIFGDNKVEKTEKIMIELDNGLDSVFELLGIEKEDKK